MGKKNGIIYKPTEEFKIEFDEKKHLFSKLCDELSIQIHELLQQNNISTVFPIECRVKSWKSICDKCKRNQLNPNKLSEIKDIAGLRVILLFQKGLNDSKKIIENYFTILEKEDTSQRLGADKFGYGSVHYILSPPKDWFSVPTLKKLNGLYAEVQVRTGTQHIWASSSHFLQYKKESDVPEPVRRSINRVAALLETVDLEFDRVLLDRETYIQKFNTIDNKSLLNTDLVAKIFDEILPPENKDDFDSEPYAEVLNDLRKKNVNSVGMLKKLLTKHLSKILEIDKEYVEKITKGEWEATDESEWIRSKRNVFYTHVGLCRAALTEEFG